MTIQRHGLLQRTQDRPSGVETRGHSHYTQIRRQKFIAIIFIYYAFQTDSVVDNRLIIEL